MARNKTRGKRTPKQIAEDFQKICDWRAQDPPLSWREIAKRISKDRGIAIQHTTLHEEYWRKIHGSQKKTAEDHIQQELARLDLLEQEYWDLYEQSKKPHTKTIKKGKTKPGRAGKGQKGKPEPQVTKEIQEHHIERLGDKNILDSIRELSRERSRLRGNYKPQKVSFTDPEGKGIEGISVVQIPDNGRDKKPEE